MKFVIHKYSKRIYQVREDHGEGKPYLRCPQDHAVRYLGKATLERFFEPCPEPGVFIPVSVTPLQEINWEKGEVDSVVTLDFSEPPKEPKPERVEKPQEKQLGGSKTLQEICLEIGMDPSSARRVLRSKKMTSPPGGWKWSDPEEIKSIKKILRKTL